MATSDSAAEAIHSADVLLSEEDILAFFLSKSGEVRNSELVSHFRRALKSGPHRATNRQQFPRFINSLATVRVDESGRKILTLKKKFRRQSDAAAGTSQDRSDDVAAGRGTTRMDVDDAASRDEQNNNEVETTSEATDGELTGTVQDDMNRTDKGSNGEQEQSNNEDVTASRKLTDDDEREEATPGSSGQQAEHPDDKPTCGHIEDTQPTSVSENEIVDDGLEVSDTSRTKNTEGDNSSSNNDHVEEAQEGNEGTETAVFADDGPNVESSGGTELEETGGEKSRVEIVVEDHSHKAEEPDDRQQSDDDGREIRRVRELAQRIDEAAGKRTSMMSLMRSTQQVRSTEPGRPSSERRRLTTTSTPYDFTMNDSQRDWTLQASYSDYQALAKLLSRSPGLAGRRDFITGYSALHWAAKNGRADVVKLLMGCSQAPDVDARSHGGYTALHVAAMSSRHDVIELLVVVYKADPDATDFTGRKPIYYLAQDTVPGRRSSTHMRSEMLLAPKRGATTSTPRKRPVLKRRQPSSTADDDEDTERPPAAAIQSLLAMTRNVTTLMLPPRDLPAVLRRRPVSSRQLSDSHSDSESAGVATDRPSAGLRPTGSTSDIVGTVV